MRRFVLLAVVTAIAFLAGCGGTETGETSKATSPGEDAVAAKTKTPEDATPAPGAEEPTQYASNHDPDRFYSFRDLPLDQGSYPRLEMADYSPEQQNRAVHRLKTEACTCGCVGDTIDECLVNDVQCETARVLARQVLREVKVEG